MFSYTSLVAGEQNPLELGVGDTGINHTVPREEQRAGEARISFTKDKKKKLRVKPRPLRFVISGLLPLTSQRISSFIPTITYRQRLG
jgi:hypothetical protein